MCWISNGIQQVCNTNINDMYRTFSEKSGNVLLFARHRRALTGASPICINLTEASLYNGVDRNLINVTLFFIYSFALLLQNFKQIEKLKAFNLSTFLKS